MNAEKTGRLISKCRKEKRLTQKEFAKELSVSDKAVSRWETGKGFPDIETLPTIADFFGITITDLLNGEISEHPLSDSGISSEDNLVTICNAASEKSIKCKKQIKTLKIVLMVLSVILSGSVIVSIFTSLFILHYKSIVGSENCVISADYGELEYFGKTYLPIWVGKNTKISVSDIILIKEAQVSGAGYVSKLPFGETIYAVNGVENNDIVYLQTESNIESRFYCKEDKYDYYRENLCTDAFPAEQCFITVTENMLHYRDVMLNEDVINYLYSLLNENESAFEEDEIEFTTQIKYSCDANLMCAGEIAFTNNGFYFSPTVTFSGSRGKHYFKLNPKYSEYFKKIVSEDTFYKDAVKRIEKKRK